MKNKFFTIVFILVCNLSFANTFPLDSFQFGTECPKIGVVLSGGGAKGIAHVGTLKMLEKLDIPIDYIGGTSMGAVIGGLYAMGYTADQLDSIVRTTKWMSLFNNLPNLEHVGVYEKINNEPYLLRLSVDGGMVGTFTKGAISGQHIDNMLNRYLYEAYKIPKFSDLKIPFFCIATDLIEGNYIVLDSGNLSQSIRASMAVPTIFAPVEMNGRLLVDGGVVNNFPVLEMRKRGVDIVIGVDVGYQYKDEAELENLAHVLEQVIFMGGNRLNNRNKENCDILISPNMETLSAIAFSRADSILERGYEAAERAYPELQQLSDVLKEKYNLPSIEKGSYYPENKITIDTIVLHGNREYSRRYILQRLQIKTGIQIPLKEVENAVQRLFGSLSFAKATYQFTMSPKNPQQVTLHLHLNEAPLNELKVGFRYDNDRGPALLAGFTAKNLLLKNAELNVNLDLSLLPIVDVQYRYSPQLTKRSENRFSIWKPSFYLSYMFCNLEMYDYFEDSLQVYREMEYAIIGQRAAVGAEISVKNNIWGLGLFLDHTNSHERVGGRGEVLNSYYWYPQLYYLRNNFDRTYYPRRGSVINARGRILFSTVEDIIANDMTMKMVQKFGTYYIDAHYAIPISKRMTFYPSAMIGGTFVFNKEDAVQNHISQQQQFYQGGLFPLPFVNQTPFVGLLFMQKSGLYSACAQFNLQYEVYKNIYLSGRFGMLKTEMDYLQMTNFENITLGAGISASVNTPVGPVGLTVHGANQSSVGFFINFGFWL